MVRFFLEYERVLKELNQIYLTLIPKTDNPERHMIKDLIDCTMYLTRLFQGFLLTSFELFSLIIISPLQGAFVPNKHIHDNS